MFIGTRVPFQALLDYLEGGDTLDEFFRPLPRRLARNGHCRAGKRKGVTARTDRMKILPDECVPQPFCRSLLPEHQ